jgi:uncharacterized membrane protein YciS (DUF1049 family)
MCDAAKEIHMRSLVQVLFAFAIALALLIALVMALPIQVIKMLVGSESRAADDLRRKAEPVQH